MYQSVQTGVTRHCIQIVELHVCQSRVFLNTFKPRISYFLSTIVLPCRPPLHQFPDGGPGRPVRLYAGHRHGVFLCETMCTFAPLLAPCLPLLPRNTFFSFLHVLSLEERTYPIFLS